MKTKSLGYLVAALGIALTAVGLWLARTFPEAAGVMAALPYVLIGLCLLYTSWASTPATFSASTRAARRRLRRPSPAPSSGAPEPPPQSAPVPFGRVFVIPARKHACNLAPKPLK